jgi:hypothetical protein
MKWSAPDISQDHAGDNQKYKQGVLESYLDSKIVLFDYLKFQSLPTSNTVESLHKNGCFQLLLEYGKIWSHWAHTAAQ